MPALDVSAARGSDGRVHIALVNVDPDRAATVSATIRGASSRGAQGSILTASVIDAHNTFDRPDSVRPKPFRAVRTGDALRFDLPPKSIVVAVLDE
jgi:alpha-N-arabinofuranosidase